MTPSPSTGSGASTASGSCSSASSSSKTRSAEAVPDWIDGRHAAQLRERLGELLRVLDERLHVAETQLAVGDHEPAEDGDADVGQVSDEHHAGHDDAGEELRLEAGLVELLVLDLELLARVGLATEDLDQRVTGERLLDTGVEAPDLAPLRAERLLRAGADHAEDDRHQRQRDEGDQRQLPRDREHHDQHADHGEHRGHDARQRLLHRLGDVVDVVRHARDELAALHLVEVRQRQAVDLRSRPTRAGATSCAP